jgi:ABC-type antimicrobial peptide transport system permease subunit
MKLVRRSIRNVLRKPLKLILVVTFLGASLMFVATMVSLSSSAQQILAAVHKQVGTAITINSVQLGTPIPNSVVSKVKRVQEVTSTQESLARSYTDGILTGTFLTINGISSDSTNFTLGGGITPAHVAGRRFQDSDANADVAMMSQSVAQANHLHVGSTFTLNGTTFTLIGLYTTSNPFANGVIIIPMAAMQQMFQINGVDSITANAVSYEQVETVAARLRSLLGKQFNVTTQTAEYSNAFNALRVAQNSIQAALVASFLIAAVVVVFAVLMLVRERTAEIAILKTIGASHMQVFRQFWTEILAMSVMAAALAVLLLVTLGPFLSQKFDIDASSLANADSVPGLPNPVAAINSIKISPTASDTATSHLNNLHLAAASLNVQTLLTILGVGIGLALLASLIPIWFVAHLKPAEVLRKANETI